MSTFRKMEPLNKLKTFLNMDILTDSYDVHAFKEKSNADLLKETTATSCQKYTYILVCHGLSIAQDV